MDFYRRFRIGPVRIYITTWRLKNPGRMEKLRQQKSRQLKYLRLKLIYKYGFCCQECGRKTVPSRLELHHIIPVKKRPDLITAKGNLQLLCHECHMKHHGKPSPQS